MPPKPKPQAPPAKTLEEVVQELDRYPVEAFLFVQEGLQHAAARIHGAPSAEPKTPRHISGQELCEGLRDFALQRWGRLSRTVLRSWGIHSTFDFGQIVFALIANQIFAKTEEDEIEDFRDVYDFRTAFEADYRIPQAQASSKGRS